MNIDEARAALSKEIVERQRLQEENAELKKYINQLDKEQKSIDKFSAAVHEEYKREIAELKRLLRLAVEDMKKITNNVAFEGLVCGGECAHFFECERVKNNDEKMYRCCKFEWKHAKEAEGILKK